MEKTIENVPNEVLIEVFKRLDGKSLKEAALVCRNWNKLIGSTSSIMKKFTLNLGDHSRGQVWWSDNFQEVMSLTRAFHSIKVAISDEEKDLERFATVTARLGAHVRLLELSVHNNFAMTNIQGFGEILKNLPLLEDLRTSSLGFAKSKLQKVSSFQSVFMKHLKKVSVRYGDYCQLQLVMGSPITHFKFNYLGSDASTTKNEEVLINFLIASEQLKAMNINKEAFESIFKSPEISKFQFKLEKLSLWPSSMSRNEAIQENFEKFLLTQAGTLRQLMVESISPGVIKTIINKLGKLDDLTIFCGCLPENKRFYESLKPSKSLRQLTLYFDFPNDISAKGLLGNCPNLKNLNMIASNPPDLQFVSINSPEIEHLIIDAISTKIDAKAKFRALKYIHVYNVEKYQDLLEFVKNNPKIETLSVYLELSVDSIEIFIETLSTQPNIKYLKLTIDDYGKAKTIYEKVKDYSGHLQSLELTVGHLKLTVPTYSYTKPRTLLFEFPIDKSKQKAECDYFDCPT